jgi:hypothetical protein
MGPSTTTTIRSHGGGLRRLGLLLGCALGLAMPAPAQEEFASQPTWWEAVRPEIVRGRDLLDSFTQSWAASRPDVERIEGWKCLGPLDHRQGQAFGHVYPPEQEINLGASYAGKDGTPVGWTDWPAGQPPPISPNATDMVLFFYREFETEAPGTLSFLFTSDDGAEIWWNGASVYRFTEPRGMNEDQPDAFMVTAQAGRNTMLVKLQQGSGAWGIALWRTATSRAPLPIEIRLRTMLLQLYPEARSDQRRDFCRRIGDGYLALGDLPNAMFWWHRELREHGEASRNARGRMEEIGRRLEGLPEADNLPDLLLPIALDDFLAAETRAIAARLLLNRRLDARQYAAVLDLLDRHREALAPVFGREAGYFRLRTLIRIGDYDAAYRAMVELEKAPEIEKDNQFRGLKDAVSGMRAGTTQLPEDWDFDANLATATKLAQEDSPRRLARFLRQTLEAKGGTLVDSGDGILFAGALPAYRQALAKHRPAYQRELERHLDLRARTTQPSPAALAQMRARLSLGEPTGRPVSPASAQGPPPRLPESSASLGFQPLASLATGALEQEATRDAFLPRLRRVSPAWAIDADDAGQTVLMQTSRQLLCLRDGRVAWSRTLPNSGLPQSEEARILGTRFVPATAGGLAYARLFSEGRFCLFALGLDRGDLAWIYDRADREPCMDPVPLSDGRLLLVVRQREVICRYFLVTLAAVTGEPLDETFLFAAPETMPANHFARAVQLDRFMPPPAIDGSLAFLAPGSGVVFALDLDSATPLWARKYSRIPFGVSQALSALLGQRRPCPPVVGERHVLFAPVDSAAVMLLDRATGRLAAADTSLDWCEIHPWIGNQALLLAPGGRLRLVSLADLTVRDLALADNQGWSIHAATPGMAILLREGELRIVSGDGSVLREALLPNAFRPLPGTSDLSLGYRADTLLPIIGRWRADVPSPLPTPFLDPDTPGDILDNPVFRQIGGETYLRSDSYLQCLGPDFRPRWAAPLHQAWPVLLPTDGRLHLIHSDRILVLDQDTGRPLGEYPGADALRVTIAAPVVIDGQLFFSEVPAGDGRSTIRRLARDGQAETVGTVQHDTVVRILDQGRRIVVLNQRHALRLDLDPATGEYPIPKDTPAFDLQMNRWDCSPRILPDGSVILFNGNRILGFKPDGSLQEIERAFPGAAWWGIGHPGNQLIIGNNFCARVIEDRWLIIDGTLGKDLADRLDTRVPPAIAGAFLAGAQRVPQRNRVRVTVAERPPGTLRHSVEVDLDQRLHWRDADPHASLVFPDGLALHLFHPQNHADYRGDLAAVLQDPRRQTTEFSSFPGPGPYRAAATSASHAALIMNNRLLVFTREELLAHLGPVKTILPATVLNTRDEQARFLAAAAVDGFPDEWDPAALQPVGRNAIAALAIHDQLHVLCELRDPELIRQIGAAGFDGRIRGRFMTGAAAGLVEITPPPRGLAFTLAPPGEDETREWQAAWSMAPDGERAWLELRLPAQLVCGWNQHYGRIFNESMPFREWRGDLAFQILLALPDGTEIPFFADQPGPPVTDPRWRFKER